MCGIAGIINLTGELTRQSKALFRMTQQMNKRGPDDEGFLLIDSIRNTIKSFYGNDTPAKVSNNQDIPYTPSAHIDNSVKELSNIAFGHRRLSIVDLTSYGHQPMCDRSRKYWIIFNGEIYNYQEIAKELVALGHNLAGKSDTEVLLNAYIQWDEKCLNKLNGMFAFAVYNDVKGEIFFARDRVGIKPFYYTIQNKKFIFASDIKSIIASKLYNPEISSEGLWHNLSFSVTPRPSTIFKNIYALEQAHWMKINLKNGKTIKEKYWQIPIGTQDHSLSETQAVSLLEEGLFQSIEYRLIADVEIGTFMSGGIDSTTMSVVASKLKPGIKAFTLGFEDDNKLDEIEQAKETANMHSMEHILKVVKANDILHNIREMVRCYEEPFCNLAPHYVISKLVASNNIKVILNGIGGDELFAGYPYYNKINLWKVLKSWQWLLKIFPFGINLKLDIIKDISTAKTVDAYFSDHYSVLKERDKKRLFKQNHNFNSSAIISQLYNIDQNKFTDEIEALNYFDLMAYIGNHHVYRIDQFTMNFSIEARLPYLDHNLIAIAFKIPSKYKVNAGKLKYILRQVAKSHIAPSCMVMKKKGFKLPVGHWMNNQLKKLTRDSLSALKKRDLFNNNEIDSLYKKHRYNDYRRVWQLVMLELWFQEFID